jgi:uncharacterized membrane protein
MPWLIVKLCLVALLIIFIGLLDMAAAKAKRGHNAEAQFAKMKNFGKVTLLTGIAIVVVAVKVFH